jgi:hypothetical protein
MRVRMCGDHVFTMDGKPFRKTDLSLREELERARIHLASLKNSRLSYPEFPGQHDFSEQEEKVRRLEAVLRESTTDSTPPAVASIADLNRLHAERYAKG